MTETGGTFGSGSESEAADGEATGRRDQVLQAVGGVLMVAGLVVAVVAYVVASNQNSGELAIDNLEHNEHTILAIVGLAGSVVGAAVFLRYSLSRDLGDWLSRMAPADHSSRG